MTEFHFQISWTQYVPQHVRPRL